MQIFPATTVSDLTTSLTSVIGDNIVPILGIVGLAVGIRFVTRWFSKSTKQVKA